MLCVSTHDPNFRTSLMQDGIKILADDASCSLLAIFDVDAARGKEFSLSQLHQQPMGMPYHV